MDTDNPNIGDKKNSNSKSKSFFSSHRFRYSSKI